MRTKSVELQSLLTNTEIQVHLDKIKHNNRSKRWDHPKRDLRNTLLQATRKASAR